MTQAKEILYMEIDIRRIHPNRYNPNELSPFMRKALRHSMSQGVKATILARPCTCDLIEGDHFEIIDGQQRWEDARDNGIATLPAMVIEEDDKEAMLDTLRMNKIKGDANPMKLVALINELQSKHSMALDEISLNSGYTAPEIKIAMNRAKQVPKGSKEKVPSKFQQFIVLGTEDEINIINAAMDKQRAKTKKEYQRNGTILAELCK